LVGVFACSEVSKAKLIMSVGAEALWVDLWELGSWEPTWGPRKVESSPLLLWAWMLSLSIVMAIVGFPRTDCIAPGRVPQQVPRKYWVIDWSHLLKVHC
jgi:hypothetical protein